MQRVVVTGATGLVGSRLCTHLEEKGYQVVRAVRRPIKDPDKELYWNPSRGEIDQTGLVGVDAVVHLAGENISGKRWTKAFKKTIRESRIQGTRLIASALAELESKPRTFCCASAIGYYGDRGDQLLSEEASAGDDFLADVCQQWEGACQPARDAGIRVVNTRIGVVLCTEGGALKKMLTPFKMGAGGVLGSGAQFMSWIALDDLVRVIEFVLEHRQIEGPVNATAPEAVTNRQFTKSLGRILSRPTLIPMPALAARLLFGEMADALLLASTRVDPQVLRKHDFEFRWATLESALRHVLDK